MMFWRQVGLFRTSRCPPLCAFLCLHVRWLYSRSGMRLFSFRSCLTIRVFEDGGVFVC